jgi:hypothetical protein
MARYLDRYCDASPPSGYFVVDAESDFLDHAFDSNIVVRGKKLCAWAILFWDGRGMSYESLQSPLQKLRIYYPAITDAEAQGLLRAVPDAQQKILNATDLRGLLQGLFPADIWRPLASLHHAAHWLLWLNEKDPPAFAQPLLKVQAAIWGEQLEGAEKLLYDAVSRIQSRAILDQWLAIEEPVGAIAELPEFPIPIPDSLHQRLETAWRRQTVEKHGIYFRTIISRQIPRELKEDVARISADYFKAHHSELESSIVKEIADFLPMEEIGALQEIVPPDVPPSPPADAALVEEWFRKSYLPYRCWAIDREEEAVRSVCRERGIAFAKWFLEFYPTALASGADTIIFRRTGRIMHDRAGKVTLMIILDGIGIWDAMELTRLIQRKQKRLTLTKDDWCFASVPTVTEICKPAMRQGVAPRNVNPNASYALTDSSIRLLEHEDAAEVLRNAIVTDFYIWSLIKTDKTYHDHGDARTIRDNIRAVLEGLANRIVAAVEAVPNQLKLNVVITTDHGRFFGRGDRTIPLPQGMKSHQRAAWGGGGNASGLTRDFQILSNERVARLHPERYGLTESTLVSIAEDSFVNNDGSTGTDWFPHGGVWPEEVIIPWLEFQRDIEPPSVHGRISGSGIEGREGDIEIYLTNSSPLELEVISVSIEGGEVTYEFPIKQKLPALDAKAITRRLSSWPSVNAIGKMSAKCFLRQPTGDTLAIKLALSITGESLQKRNADLDDLL